MAYGDGYPPEELEHTEFLFRIRDLVDEWHEAFFELVDPGGYRAARGEDDAAQRLVLEWAERRLEETAMDLSLHLKARRLKREAGLEHHRMKREEGAA